MFSESFAEKFTDETLSECPVELTLERIGGRWKVLILHELFGGTRRFGELHRALPGITQKMLTQQLRELERDDLIHRQIYPQVPPKVEYSLTPLGQTLRPVLDALHAWGRTYAHQRQFPPKPSF
ncbi:MAG TPA: transcriptional regulator [Cyanobacteria bacterium UBA8156]|nr:transcriptional regulator [Cyanobacteria bacterium UBA8156]